MYWILTKVGSILFFEQKGKTLSTYEKQLEKQRSKIEEMEKMNLEPKTWTMAGEVSTYEF